MTSSDSGRRRNRVRSHGLVLAAQVLATAATLGFTTLTHAAAPTWPTRPITIICPYPPGISTDALTRSVAQAMSQALGQSVIVENKPGASATIGSALAARAAPDGYTLLIGTMAPMITAKHMYKTLSYDPEKGFAPVVMLASSPMIIVGSPKLEANNLAEFLAGARNKSSRQTASSVGHGSQGHVTVELLNKLAGTSIVHVPYRDVNQALPDLMSGDVQIGVNYVPTFVPNVQSGQLKGLAVTSSERLPDLPNVPTVAESGFPGFEASGWNGLFAPAGTPRDVVVRINKVVNDYLQSDEGKRQVSVLKMTAMGGSSEEMKRYLEKETVRWTPIFKEAGITPQ